MVQQIEEIREQQKASWNKFSTGWKKWDDLTMDFIEPMGNEIIRLLQPKEDDVILDVASGTGEPGLTISSMLTDGKVVLTDLSEEMLEVAREKAQNRGVENVQTVVCDVTDMPFADNTFDGISCRFGFMFFPDMQQATREMVRVLKPGGKLAAAVWGVPEKNFWVTAIMGAIKRNMDLPAPPKDAPGMFRCAEDGMLRGIFEASGLKNVSQNEISGLLNCKTADTYWDLMTEVAAPVVAALNEADDNLRTKIKREVCDQINEKYQADNVAINASALVVSGEK